MALLFITFVSSYMPVYAGMLGEQYEITTNHASWSPSICYNPYSDKYLVLYQNAEIGYMRLQGRCINASDRSMSAEFSISYPHFTSSCSSGSIAYNSDNHEWFVVYATDADIGGDIIGQRIASNGTLIGGPIYLNTEASYQETAVVAYDSDNKRYLVVWKDYRWNPVIRGCFFDANGSPINDPSTYRDGSTTIPTFRISDNIRLGCGYNQGVPKLTYNPVAKNYLAIWSDYRNFPEALSQICAQNNDYGDIFGQIIDASGNRLAVDKQIYPRPVTPYVPEGLDLPSLACNLTDGSYFIGITKLSVEYGRWVTRGVIIDQNANWFGNDFPASSPFRGSCRGLAYNPHSNTYFWSNGDVAEDISGRLFSSSGQQQGVALTSIITTPNPIEEIFGALAVRPSDGQYLQVSIGLGVYNLTARFFNTYPPGAVNDFTASGDGGQNTLRWTNPTDTDLATIMIRYSTTGYPATMHDGALVVEKSGEPGENNIYVHSGLVNGTTYYYSVFARNVFDEYSTKVTASATPNAANILNPLHSPSTFCSISHGWTLTNWDNDANSANWGSIVREGGVGNPTYGIRCKGYGVTDDNRRDLREGGEMKRVISTLGYTNIKLSYDLRVGALGIAWSGAGSGSGNVVNNDVQDQLIVYYSKTGIDGPWFQADWLGHDNLLDYRSYGRRSVDLSAIAGIADNPNFAVKFMWQFNSKLEAGDYGDLDNVVLVGDLIPDPIPPTATVGAPSVLSTSTGPIVYTVNFSESVTGFTTSNDVIVNKTGTATAGSVTISGSGAGPYTVTLSNISGSGTLGITVKAGACSDVAGNSNTASSPSAKTLVISTDGSIAIAKTALENSNVTLGNKVLYYKNGAVGYIEESDRFAGIRIEGSISQAEGEKVSLSGAVKTNASGERYILLDAIVPAGSESVGALGTNNRSAKLAVMDGLLTTAWGIVAPDSITSNSFVISDGSDSEGIKIITVGVPGVTENAFVTVTGAAGKEDGKRVIYRN